MKKGRVFIILVLSIILSGTVAIAKMPVALVKPATPPVIDGNLDEPIWQTASTFSDFKTYKPDYGLAPSEQTRVYVAYDAKNLYFGIRSMDSSPNKIKASVSKRDNLGSDDWIAVELDTFNNGQSNYFFRVNPIGIQADGIIDSAGRDDFTFDTLWHSRGRLKDDGYEVEIAIPFKSLRFPAKQKILMGMAVRRGISRKSEILTFPEYDPRKGSRLSQRTPIRIEGIKFKRSYEIIPAVTASGTGNRPIGGANWQTDSMKNYSMTAKMGLTSTLNLEATYNPDFSHVESDAGRIDVNLRNALFYPEKRQFFQEGQEHFSFAGRNAGYGSGLKRIVDTRTIVDPLVGFKLTGNLGQNNTLAALFALDESPNNIDGIQNDENQKENQKNSGFTILRYKRKLKQDGYIGGFFTGKAFDGGYNRLTGIDGRFRLSGKNRIEYHAFGSFSKDRETGLLRNGSALGLEFSHVSRKITFNTGIRDISRHFKTDVGYYTHTGITRLPLDFSYHIYPRSDFFKKIKFLYNSQHTLHKAHQMVDTYNWMGLEFIMPRDTFVYFGYNYRTEVFGGHRFSRAYFGLGGRTQIFKQLRVRGNMLKGDAVFYDIASPYQGRIFSGDLTITYQPTAKINTELSYIYSDFHRKSSAKRIYEYSIVRSKTTYQFNKFFSIRAIGEYNSYYKRFNADVLAAFTYVPGTVFLAGYGSVYQRPVYEEEHVNIPSHRYLQTRRQFFVKASYRFRF